MRNYAAKYLAPLAVFCASAYPQHTTNSATNADKVASNADIALYERALLTGLRAHQLTGLATKLLPPLFDKQAHRGFGENPIYDALQDRGFHAPETSIEDRIDWSEHGSTPVGNFRKRVNAWRAENLQEAASMVGSVEAMFRDQGQVREAYQEFIDSPPDTLASAYLKKLLKMELGRPPVLPDLAIDAQVNKLLDSVKDRDLSLAETRRVFLKSLDQQIAEGERSFEHSRLEAGRKLAAELRFGEPYSAKFYDAAEGTGFTADQLAARAMDYSNDRQREAYLAAVPYVHRDLKLIAESRDALIQFFLNSPDPVEKLRQHMQALGWARRKLISSDLTEHDKQVLLLSAQDLADYLVGKGENPLLVGEAAKQYPGPSPAMEVLQRYRDAMRERISEKESLSGALSDGYEHAVRSHPLYTSALTGAAGLGALWLGKSGISAALSSLKRRAGTTHERRLQKDPAYRVANSLPSSRETCEEGFRLISDRGQAANDSGFEDWDYAPREIARRAIEKTHVVPILEQQVFPALERVDPRQLLTSAETKQSAKNWFAFPPDIYTITPHSMKVAGKPYSVYEMSSGEAYYFDLNDGKPKFAVLPGDKTVAVPTHGPDGRIDGWQKVIRYQDPSQQEDSKYYSVSSGYLPSLREQINLAIKQRGANVKGWDETDLSERLDTHPLTPKSLRPAGSILVDGVKLKILESGPHQVFVVNKHGAPLVAINNSIHDGSFLLEGTSYRPKWDVLYGVYQHLSSEWRSIHIGGLSLAEKVTEDGVHWIGVGNPPSPRIGWIDGPRASLIAPVNEYNPSNEGPHYRPMPIDRKKIESIVRD